MANKWMTHVKKTMKHMSSKKKSMGKSWFKHVLKSAKSTYHKKGGGPEGPAAKKAEAKEDKMPEVSPAPTKAEEAGSAAASLAEGGRRRRTRKHRRRHH